MWDERYAGDDYMYGTEPNTFLQEHAHRIRGPVLSIAEGEGRNAVFLASLGLDVLGVDSSRVGLRKAEALAKAKRVTIKTEVADLVEYVPVANHYGAVISIFAHLPGSVRSTLYPHIERCLKPGGLILMQAYAEQQIEKTTGGPKDVDLLMSVKKVKAELPNLEPILLKQVEREVNEGKLHTGMASVIQFIGMKR